MNKRLKKKRGKERALKARTRVLFDTGTRVHAPDKGKGSYRRRRVRDDGADG